MGGSPLRAIVAGIATFVVGLVTWTVYHLTSGRNDGLLVTAFLVMPATTFLSKPASFLVTIGGLALLTVVVAVPFAWFMGRCMRASAAAKPMRSRPESSLYDADLDDGHVTT